MNKKIRSALKNKNKLYNKYISGGKKQEQEIKLHANTIFVSNLMTSIKDSNNTNIAKRLNGPKIGAKTYQIKIATIPSFLWTDLL